MPLGSKSSLVAVKNCKNITDRYLNDLGLRNDRLTFENCCRVELIDELGLVLGLHSLDDHIDLFAKLVSVVT
jgi:hypothetical protein